MFVVFILGLTVGILVNPSKQRVIEVVREVYQEIFTEKAQFVEPITDKEKFNNANNINDLLQ